MSPRKKFIVLLLKYGLKISQKVSKVRVTFTCKKTCYECAVVN